MPLFINCGISALLDPVHRVDQMLLVLEAVDRPPSEVVLEITERELVGDLNRLRQVVTTYRQQGFRFAIDDVGEGHSTLEVLAATEPEFVKVARSLVVEAWNRGPQAAIRALVAFAASMDAQVIAEGIEDAGVATAMRHLGVGLGQGYLFGRPALPVVTAPQPAAAGSDATSSGWSVRRR
jgi:EAL domain-containing protein (putative c-di-GMP-specific phosphodiesterase class I)